MPYGSSSDLLRRLGEMPDVGGAAALVVDDSDLVAVATESQHRAEEVLGRRPKSHDERTIQARSPAARLAVQLRASVRGERPGASDST